MALSNIHVPTMLVHGLLSDVVTQDGVDDLVARIPDATVVAVDGAAHMIAGDRNDAFSDAVVAFLEDRIRPDAALSRPRDGPDQLTEASSFRFWLSHPRNSLLSSWP